MRLHRRERMSSLIAEKLAWMIEREIEIPGSLITITGVEITDKFELAAVKVSVYPSEKKEAVMNVLIKLAGHFQFELIRLLNIKPIPRIHFKYDDGPRKAAAVEKGLMKEEEQLGL